MANPNVGFSIFNGLAPVTKSGADGAPIQGPRVITLPFLFTALVNSIVIELFKESTEKQLDFVQTVFVDNQRSALPLTIAADITQHRLYIPAARQAILPIFCIAEPRFTLTKVVVGADETVNVSFLNIAMGPCVWG